MSSWALKPEQAGDNPYLFRYLPKGRVAIRVHPEDTLFEVLARIAAAGRVPSLVYDKAAETGFYISRAPLYMEGRIELLQYIQEQAVSHNYHRYGNLGERAQL